MIYLLTTVMFWYLKWSSWPGWMWQVPPLEQGKLIQALMGNSQFWPWRRGQGKKVNNWTLYILNLETISLFKQRQLQSMDANHVSTITFLHSQIESTVIGARDNSSLCLTDTFSSPSLALIAINTDTQQAVELISYMLMVGNKKLNCGVPRLCGDERTPWHQPNDWLQLAVFLGVGSR